MNEEMTEKQMHIKIAEACNWYDIYVNKTILPYLVIGTKPIGNNKFIIEQQVPDYLHDRNAMFQALVTMTDEEWEEFVFTLIHKEFGYEFKHGFYAITFYCMRKVLTCPLDKLGKCFLQVKGVE